MTITKADRTILLAIARDSILSGLGPEQPAADHLIPESLEAIRATFVTLTHNAELRGCIGTLEAHDKLHKNVASNAYAAAFSDPRFPPVTRPELDQLSMEISILGIPERVDCETEAVLLEEMESSRCGWIVREQNRQATFLPSVWSSLNSAEVFLQELKRKAGLPHDYWSDDMQYSRYTTTVFSALLSDIPAQRLD